MPGPPPKPAHLRQRMNKKAGNAVLTARNAVEVPEIPNPDARVWHELTLKDWAEWWQSEMASQWLPTDVSGLGLLAIIVDNFYKEPNIKDLQEIRLQRQCFGLTPLDRSRLQWEVARGEEADQQRKRAKSEPAKPANDLRKVLRMVNG